MAWTKVKAKDIKNQAFLTTGTAPNYEITIPRETSYADMDRMEILVNFHDAGSGTITLNVNGLWAKTLDWVTSITADEYMSVVFDVSQDKFLLVSWASQGWGWGWNTWDLSNAVLDQDEVLTFSWEKGMNYDTTGTKLLFVNSSHELWHTTLTTAYDITTAWSIWSVGTVWNLDNFCMTHDWLHMATVYKDWSNHAILKTFSLSTAYDATTATLISTQDMWDIWSQSTWSINMSDDWLNLIYRNTANTDYYTLGTAWDLSTLSFVWNYGTPYDDMRFDSTWTKAYWLAPNGWVDRLSLSTAWDITTATLEEAMTITNITYTKNWIHLKDDLSKMIIKFFDWTDDKYQTYDLVWSTWWAVTSVNWQTWDVVLDTWDISEVANKRYVTDAEKTTLWNTSWTNTWDETASSIKSKYESNADTNAFTDAEKTKLWQQSWINTWDQDASEVDVDTTNFNNNLSSADNTVQKALETLDQMSGWSGTDTNAVHKNVAWEIHAITEKTTPIGNDEIIIEDSNDSYNKKRVKVSNLPAPSSTNPLIKSFEYAEDISVWDIVAVNPATKNVSLATFWNIYLNEQDNSVSAEEEIDTNKIMMAYSNNSSNMMWVVWIIDRNRVSYWTEVNLWLDTTNGTTIENKMIIEKIDTDKVMLWMTIWNDTDKLLVATVSWTSISVGSKFTIPWWVNVIDIVSIDIDKALIVYNKSWAVYWAVATVSWTSISLWSEVNIPWSTELAIEKTDTDKCLLVNRDGSSSSNARVISISWTSISVGSATSLSVMAYEPSLSKVSWWVHFLVVDDSITWETAVVRLYVSWTSVTEYAWTTIDRDSWSKIRSLKIVRHWNTLYVLHSYWWTTNYYWLFMTQILDNSLTRPVVTKTNRVILLKNGAMSHNVCEYQNWLFVSMHYKDYVWTADQWLSYAMSDLENIQSFIGIALENWSAWETKNVLMKWWVYSWWSYWEIDALPYWDVLSSSELLIKNNL